MKMTQPSAMNRNAPPAWSSWLGAVWLLGFCGFFYSFTLPNNAAFSRVDLWLELPELLLSLTVPGEWGNFAQRFDLLRVAIWIHAGAWGIGSLLLRAIRVPLPTHCLERTVFACTLGLSAVSLLTLLGGLAGVLVRGWLGGILLLAAATEAVLQIIDVRRRWQSGARNNGIQWRALFSGRFPYRYLLFASCLIAVLPFLLAMLLGALLPSIDFDVKEYHLQGPKEFFQQGRITRLPHNVYTSFPFLTEMLTLAGMVLRNDWFRGALVGKAVLMGFAPLTGLAILAAGRRWFSPTVGWLALLIHLSTPWTYRISIIAYAEGGLTCYLFVSLLAIVLAIDAMRSGRTAWHFVLLAGLLAGSAMACKYPGVVQVVIPLGLALSVAAWWYRHDSRNVAVSVDSQQVDGKEAQSSQPATQQSNLQSRTDAADCQPRVLSTACIFALGTLITIGPWLVKNAVETGNPVYPLLYSAFGGRDWNDEVNTRWKKAHGPDNYAVSDLGEKFIDVTAKSDWQSPLLFALAPLALLAGRSRRLTRFLWLYVAWLFCSWWILTHRLDRFWIPMIPVVSLLAGVGATWRQTFLWKWTCGFVIAAAVLFNLGFVTTRLCGYNAYLADLDLASQAVESTAPGIEYLNQKQLPADTVVLCVGEAQVFDARFSLRYNTVFAASIFQEMCAKPEPGVADSELEMLPADVIRENFRAAGITHVYVNWQEILRYRPTYGYTGFVTPARFAWLQEQGILGPAFADSYRLADYEQLSPGNQRELDAWAPELRTTVNGRQGYVAAQVFPVRP